MRGKRLGDCDFKSQEIKIMKKNDNEVSISTSLRAAINVGFANTFSMFCRPIHAAKTIIGLEKDKSIMVMIRDEERRIMKNKIKI